VLSRQQVELIRKSFRHVSRHGDVAALVFYQKLFELDPGLRPLFTTDIKEQSRKLTDMLASAVGMLDEPEKLLPTLEALGARHVNYGVREEHYATVGKALVAMLDMVLKEKLTADVRSAWLALYTIMAETMLRGAARTES